MRLLVIDYIKSIIKRRSVNPELSLRSEKMAKPPRPKARPRRSATIQDVAARAGVSTATVSRTLANPDIVSADTRARVLAAVRATGYTPNVAARNLRARRAMMVLVVVPNVANSFFAEVLRGIDDELVASGYGMIIGNLDNLVEREARYVDLAFAGQVDGVLLMNGRIPAGNGRLMTEAGLPMATICVALAGLPYVMVDDDIASRAVMRHLLGLGHRRFGYIGGPTGNMNEIGRRAGFVAALEEAGIAPASAVYWPGDFMLEAGVAAGRAYLAAKRRPTAIYAASDYMAIGFMKTVSEGGARVPEDVSVVGFDGIEFSDFATPRLTTIRQPRHELGRTGARVLLAELNRPGGGRPGVHLDAPLVLRESTGPAPGRRALRRLPHALTQQLPATDAISAK
jgi:LacI family repressor for deo operon, udp, cdd, tsx, nupC, and nupG